MYYNIDYYRYNIDYYYNRIVIIHDVTIYGLKCMAEIGKLQGPSIYCYYLRSQICNRLTITRGQQLLAVKRSWKATLATRANL